MAICLVVDYGTSSLSSSTTFCFLSHSFTLCRRCLSSPFLVCCDLVCADVDLTSHPYRRPADLLQRPQPPFSSTSTPTRPPLPLSIGSTSPSTSPSSSCPSSWSTSSSLRPLALLVRPHLLQPFSLSPLFLTFPPLTPTVEQSGALLDGADTQKKLDEAAKDATALTKEDEVSV
jgi:hypothetical protein